MKIVGQDKCKNFSPKERKTKQRKTWNRDKRRLVAYLWKIKFWQKLKTIRRILKKPSRLFWQRVFASRNDESLFSSRSVPLCFLFGLVGCHSVLGGFHANITDILVLCLLMTSVRY